MDLLSIDEQKFAHLIKKVRQLCEYIPNLIIYDADLTVEAPQLHQAVAVILEARRKCKLTPIWPEELDLIIFGPKSDK